LHCAEHGLDVRLLALIMNCVITNWVLTSESRREREQRPFLQEIVGV